MICGGRVQVLLEHIAADPATRQIYQGLNEALGTGEKCFLVTDLRAEGVAGAALSRCLVRQDSSLTGEFRHPVEWLPTLVAKAHHSTYPVLASIEHKRFLIERCYMPSTVYLFGAGHVSQEVAELASKVAFQTVVLDDRAEFANRELFPLAEEVRVIDSFTDCLAGLEIDQDSYLVIVTRGHTHDKTVLAQALRTRAGYIGMLGSRKKSVEIRQALLSEGFSEETVARFNCPIGLKIDAETTAEIAVSIVAELIQARAAWGNDGR